ncbi:MAG: acyl-CoA dehydrogenase family protein, partial [Sphingorhabdus sp.]
MNFDFSDDQRRLQEEIRRVLTDVSTSAEVRTVLEGSAPHSAQTWSHLADLGALGIALPEIYSGSGMGHLELCLVAEEAGRSLAAAPLFSTVYLAAEAINRAGSKEQKELWLPLIASAKLVATAVLDPRIQRTTAAMPLTIAANRVSGSLHAVPDGMTAQLAVLLIDDQLVSLDLSAGNVTRQPVKSIDPTRPLATLHFEAAMAQSLGEKSGLQIAQSVT